MRKGRMVFLVGVVAVFGSIVAPTVKGLHAAPPPAGSQAIAGPTDLGTLSGNGSCGLRINDHGEAIGSSHRTATDEMPSAFVWRPATGMVDPLPAVPFTDARTINRVGDALISNRLVHRDGSVTPITSLISANAVAFDVNDRGQIAGNFVDAQLRSHAMFWSVETGRVDLGTLSGSYTTAVGINENGAVFGERLTTAGVSRGFFWQPGGTTTNLGALGASSDDVWPSGINEDGWITGTAMTPGDLERAFLWRPGTGMTDLGTLGGDYSTAGWINDQGTIVGTAQAGAAEFFTEKIFRWTPAGGMASLGIGGDPRDVNNHEQIVGNVNGTPFVWDPVNGARPLPGVGALAASINDRGQILGCARLSPSVPPAYGMHAVVWTVDTPTQVHWSAEEHARIQQLMTFYDMDYDELTKFGVYVAAFINGIDPSPTPTPITVGPPGTAQTQTITWHPDEIALLEAVKQRWVLDDEGAHRWGYMLLNFIATIQGG